MAPPGVSSSDSRDNLHNPKNPYRQQPHPPHPLSRSTSQDAEYPVLVRHHTPTRAVFDDLHTAHSRITSGNARNGRRPLSTDLFDPPNEDNAIPLQAVKPFHESEVKSVIHKFPLPPAPAAMSSSRYEYDIENLTPLPPRSRSAARLSNSLKAESGSLLANIRRVLSPVSSPITPETIQGDKDANWPLSNTNLGNVKKVMGFADHMKQDDDRVADPSALPTHVHKAQGRCAVDGSSAPYPDNDVSVYHSSLGEAPSGSAPRNSHDEGSAGNFSYLNPYKVNRHSYNSYQSDTPSPLRKSSSDTTPKRHSININRATSTVGDIYRHYVPSSRGHSYESDSEDEVNEESPLRGDLTFKKNRAKKLSELNVRKQRVQRLAESSQQGEAPNFPLPSTPSLAVPITKSSTQGIGASSSYGDTRKLLDFTEQPKTVNAPGSKNRGLGLSPDSDSEADIAIQTPVPVNLVTPKVVISPADDISIYGDDPHWTDPIMERQPLEREVSEALRRASGYSAYSMESYRSSLEKAVHENNRFQQASLTLPRRYNVENTPPSDSGSMNSDQREFAAQAQAFYDRGAIPSDWITARHQNVVRIPISHSANFPDSPPDSPTNQAAVPCEKQSTPNEEDQNDWETVGESAFGINLPSRQGTPGMMGANRAGSSIAGVSDEDTTTTEASDLPVIDEYGSSERIAQHPGTIQYSGDYRQRDLKKTHIPVFLPVFREHKINGYLADSNRTRPTPNYQINNAPLGRLHHNPFKSPPPEVMTTSGVKASRGLHANQAPPSLATSEESADFTRNLQKLGGREAYGNNLRCDWGNNHGEPGPAIRGTLGLNHSNSWRDILALGKGSDATDTTGGTRNPTSDETVDTPTMGGRRKKSLLKRPPGAFYQDLRKASVSDSKPATWSHARRPSRIDYPTNGLRPLSLLRKPATDSRPVTPVHRVISEGSESSGPNKFVYRSPLAPPKRPSWQQMYSPEQLRNFRESADADGLFESQPVISLQEDANGNTWKRLLEYPKLSPFSQDPLGLMVEAERKRKISMWALALCNFFPPMLFLYAIGRLDGIMVWYTEGDFSHFAVRQKKYAWVLLFVWSIAVVIGLGAFLVIFFTKMR